LAEAPNPLILTESDEIAHAQALAHRYRCDYIDLKDFPIKTDVIRSVPVDIMFRYNFLPLERHEGSLVIAVTDPSRLTILDEIAGLLGKHIIPRVATPSQITDLLKKTEQSQRVVDEATVGLTFDTISSDDNTDENICIENLTSQDASDPIIRLVDTIMFTALGRRASDVHFETYDHNLHVRYRIDGVLHPAIAPIAREHESTILSRIKVMSELDITERRVPQDGRFRIRYKNRLIDIRVSIMPTVHGENAVLRILDKESMSEKFSNLTLDVVGFADDDLQRFRRYIREPYMGWCWSLDRPARVRPRRSMPHSTKSIATKTRSSLSKIRWNTRSLALPRFQSTRKRV
jgi:type IV pilus assembly protein PilB